MLLTVLAGLHLLCAVVKCRVSTTTGNTSEFSHFNHRRRRRKHRMPVISRASSFSSITDSTMSLNIITVELSMGQSCVHCLCAVMHR